MLSAETQTPLVRCATSFNAPVKKQPGGVTEAMNPFTQFVLRVLVLGLQHGLQLCALQQVALELSDHLPDLLQQLRG